jgi:hypothetical protein
MSDVFPGPFKYMPFKKSLGAIIVGMSVHGFGLGASVVGGFSDAHKSALKAGFPDTIDTYGLVSGLWTSVFAFGAFVGEKPVDSLPADNLTSPSGPTFGGILFDAVTFRWAILLVIIGELISLTLLTVYLCLELCGTREPEADTGHLVPSLPTIGESRDYGAAPAGTSVVSARARKFSESVGRSYVASSVARCSSGGVMTLRSRSYRHGGSQAGFTASGLGGLAGRGGRAGEREPLIA